ncbi:MAG: sigma-70 family RNA polymerase sigma factor [Lachnospiraceae bacterium]|nr:sigma-70 family RNA polymerase sigma factor [Lachnospiraceae bacterium]
MEKYQNSSDEELIRRLRQGESEIEDFLMDKYKNLVKIRARAMYLIGGETDDLIQEGMIGLFKAIRDYREDRDAAFATFAKLCVERQLYRTIESSNRQKNQPLNTYISLDGESQEEELQRLWEESPEAIVVDREHTDAMIERIHKALSPFENHVLNLYMNGYTYIQIAEMMDKSPKSIDNALQRIRSKVRDILEPGAIQKDNEDKKH